MGGGPAPGARGPGPPAGGAPGLAGWSGPVGQRNLETGEICVTADPGHGPLAGRGEPGKGERGARGLDRDLQSPEVPPPAPSEISRRRRNAPARPHREREPSATDRAKRVAAAEAQQDGRRGGGERGRGRGGGAGGPGGVRRPRAARVLREADAGVSARPGGGRGRRPAAGSSQRGGGRPKQRTLHARPCAPRGRWRLWRGLTRARPSWSWSRPPTRYFTQFGEVLRVKLSRSKKTGRR